MAGRYKARMQKQLQILVDKIANSSSSISMFSRLAENVLCHPRDIARL
jgi:hypothetical protein